MLSILLKVLYHPSIHKQQLKMRKSCHQQNNRLLQAYTHFKKGQLPQSLSIYESLLQNTTDRKMRANIICTISVICIGMANYNYALQLLQDNLDCLDSKVEIRSEQFGEEVGCGGTLKIRYYANLCFLQLLMGFYEQALDTVRVIRGFFESNRYNSTMLSFLLMLFFRVNNFQQISKQHQIAMTPGILDAYYMLNLAFAKDLCNFQGSQNLLKAAYPIFISHNQSHLAIIALRQLLLLPLSNKETQKYEKQLSKIISMGMLQSYELDNSQQLDCCKSIAHELIEMSRNFGLTKKTAKQSSIDDRQVNDVNNNFLWRLVLDWQKKKVKTHTQIAETQRNAILDNIRMMIQESNPIVINQMKKTDFYISSQRQIKYLLNSFVVQCQKIGHKQFGFSFSKIKAWSKKIHKPNQVRNKSQNNFDRREQKQNKMPFALARDRSSKSLIADEKKLNRVPCMKSPLVSGQKQIPKTILKMLKFCEYGAFLSKRNFNSDGGEYRFVRVTQSVLKWAKNPDKIEQSCQLYPLKDINSITYGKHTPTLLKPSNHLLKQQYCFSLRLQKRTLDFYCKNFEQTCNWVCGLSHKLEQMNPNIKKYSIGKMLWKRMFMIMKDNFTSKIKVQERKFYYETAQAVILFGKNGYKLPTK